MTEQSNPTPLNAPRPLAAKKQTVDAQLFEKIAHDANTVGANLRILEERYSLMRNKSTVTEESMIELERNISKDLKGMSEDIMELKHELKEVMDTLRLIDSEMKNLTSKDEFKVVDKYIDMWQPLDFVTRNEIDRLVEEKVSELKKLNKSPSVHIPKKL